MTITYPVHSGLYVNLTNRCPCACSFCIRNNGRGAYGSDSLWLDREPTADEVVASIDEKLKLGVEVEERRGSHVHLHLSPSPKPRPYSELVFCGYGEPTERLDVLLDVARRVKAKWPGLPIRVNTNGLSDLINEASTASRFAGLVDAVSVSLNAPTAEEYFALCCPKFGMPAFAAVLDFTRAVKCYVPSVVMTVVATEDFTDAKREACEAICRGLGVPLRVRTLISAS